MTLRIFVCLFIFLGSLQLSLEDSLAIPEKEFIGIFDKLTFDEHPELDFTSKILETSSDQLTVTKKADSVNLPVFAFGVPIDDFTRLINFQAITATLSSAPFNERKEKAISECISQLNQNLKVKFSQGFDSIPEKGPIEIKLTEFQTKYQLIKLDAFLEKCYIKSSCADPKDLAHEIEQKLYHKDSFDNFRKLIIEQVSKFQGDNEISLQSLVDALNNGLKYDQKNTWIASFATTSFNFEPKDFVDQAYFRTIKIKSNETEPMESIDEFLNIYLTCIDKTLENFKNNDNNCASEFINIVTNDSYLAAFYKIVRDGISKPEPSLIKQHPIPINEFNSKLSEKFTFHIAFADLPEKDQHGILGDHLKSGNVSVPWFTTLDEFKKYVEEESSEIRKKSQVLTASSATDFFKQYFNELFLEKRIKYFLNITEDEDKVKKQTVPSGNDDEDKKLVQLTKSYQQPVKSKADKGMIVLFVFSVTILIILFIVIVIGIVYKIRQSKQNHLSVPIAA